MEKSIDTIILLHSYSETERNLIFSYSSSMGLYCCDFLVKANAESHFYK